MSSPSTSAALDGALFRAAIVELARPWTFGVLLMVVGGLILCRTFWSTIPRDGRRGRHLTSAQHAVRYQLRFRRAQIALAALRKIGPRANPERAFRFLRAAPGFVFEEMILLELAHRGLKVRRTPRNGSAGDLDGQFWLGEAPWRVRTRCYSGAVQLDDISRFYAFCQEQHCGGLFVHTGWASPAAFHKTTQADRVVVVSGERLVEFFAGGPMDLRLARPARASPSDRSSAAG